MNTQRNEKGQFERTRSEINNEMSGADIEPLHNLLFGKSIKRTLSEMFIAGVYGYALGCAAGVVIDALMLLAMPAFFQIACTFAVITIAVWFAFITGHHVSNYVADKSVAAFSFVKTKLNTAKEAFSEKFSTLRVVH